MKPHSKEIVEVRFKDDGQKGKDNFSNEKKRIAKGKQIAATNQDTTEDEPEVHVERASEHVSSVLSLVVCVTHGRCHC